jgi:hypothetical protein
MICSPVQLDGALEAIAACDHDVLPARTFRDYRRSFPDFAESLPEISDGAGLAEGSMLAVGLKLDAYSGTPAFFRPSMKTGAWAYPPRLRCRTLMRIGGPTRFLASMTKRASSSKPKWPQQLINAL